MIFVVCCILTSVRRYVLAWGEKKYSMVSYNSCFGSGYESRHRLLVRVGNLSFGLWSVIHEACVLARTRVGRVGPRQTDRDMMIVVYPWHT